MKKANTKFWAGMVLGGVLVDALVTFSKSNSLSKGNFGASFSHKYASDLGLDWRQTLLAMLNELPIQRLRLMSHWDGIELEPGKRDFSLLDWQYEKANHYGVSVTQAVGLRQPHYPECHQPGWARQLSKADRDSALMDFVAEVVKRYRGESVLESWQLENEAFNRGFGMCDDFDRRRVIAEMKLVKSLDAEHPLIMTISDNFGFPVRRPRPDVIGFSIYRRYHKGQGYENSPLPSIYYRLRAALIERYIGRPVIIHELQAEPWGPGGTQDLALDEQDKSMDALRLEQHVQFALSTGIRQIDLWGAEWWYWRKAKFNDDSSWQMAIAVMNNSN